MDHDLLCLVQGLKQTHCMGRHISSALRFAIVGRYNDQVALVGVAVACRRSLVANENCY